MRFSLPSPAQARRAKVGAVGALAIACCLLAGVTAGPAAAQTRPAIDSLPLDAYHYDWAKRCRGHAQTGTRALERWIARNYIGESWGMYECRGVSGTGNVSLHAEGRALDWRLDAGIPRERKAAEALIGRLTAKDSLGRPDALARRMGLQEIIFNCRIWLSDGGSGWSRYRVCNQRDRKGRLIKPDRTDAHKDHVHLGLNWDGARRKTSFWAYGYDSGT
jgi:hypothetical protein